MEITINKTRTHIKHGSLHCKKCNSILKVDWTLDIFKCVECGHIYIKNFKSFITKAVRNVKIDELLTAEEFKEWKSQLEKDRCKQGEQRRKYINFWYSPKETIEYWKAIGERDFKILERLCKCRDGLECPAHQMLRVLKDK